MLSLKSGHYRLLAALLIAAVLVWLFYPRDSNPPLPQAPPAGVVPVPGVSAPVAVPAGGKAGATPAGGQTPAAHEEGGPSAQGTASAAAGSGTADERQLVKIARGLSTAADGALHVTATPPGSVVGQLHLQPGDVIVSVNGQPVASPEDFARIYHEQGLPSEITLIREGRELHRH